jgi:AraC-like DNA-binding protein
VTAGLFYAKLTAMIDRSSENSSLAAMLQDLRPVRASYARVTLGAPWGLELPFQDGVRFHLAVSGTCLLIAPNAAAIELQPGDIALLPHGDAHSIRDHATSATVELSSAPRRSIGQDVYELRAGADGKPTLLVCCTIEFASPEALRILAEMPALIVVRASGGGPSLKGLVDLMADETRRERIGMATLLPRIADVIVTWTVRAWVEDNAAGSQGWLAAMRAPGLGAALAAIHRDPGKRWTIAELARAAAMSRTSFVARFTEIVGQPPGRYVREWRMALAMTELERKSSIADTSAALGYGSGAAFSRAFKRVRGVSPGQVRTQRQN